MTTDYHTPWSDWTTEFRASFMNPPLAELDEAIGELDAAVDQLDISSFGYVYPSNEKPAAGTEINIMVVKTIGFAANFSGSLYFAATGPAAEAVVSIKRNGATFGTLTVAIGETTGGTWSSGSKVLNAGDRLTLSFPNPADADWAGVSIALKTGIVGVTTTTTTSTSTTSSSSSTSSTASTISTSSTTSSTASTISTSSTSSTVSTSSSTSSTASTLSTTSSSLTTTTTTEP